MASAPGDDKAGLDESIFRAYDIRGRVGDQIRPDVVKRIARAYASRYAHKEGATLVISRDLRQSSAELAEAATAGVLSTGVNVVDVGEAPTPLLYLAIGLWDFDGGIGVTASHLPPSQNGMKVRRGDGPFFGPDLQALKDEVLRGEFASGTGSYTQRDVYPEFYRLMAQQVSVARPVKVVLDLGNGCGTLTAPKALRAMGCEVITLFEEPDGTFPGRGPDPTHAGAMDALRAKVLETGAELGIAIDADGDRIAVIDHRGQIAQPDQYMLPLCRARLAEGSATIVTEVRCSQSIVDDIRQHGGEVALVPVGYPFILTAMREHGSPIGFETTGHCYFDDPYFKFDDATFASALLLAVLSRTEETLHDIIASAPVYFPAEPPRVECSDDRKFALVAEVADHFRGKLPVIETDGVRVQYPDGWSVLRASNTAGELVMRWEGKTPEARDRIGEELMEEIRKGLR